MKCSDPLQSSAKSLSHIAGMRILSPLRLPIPPSGPGCLSHESNVRGAARECAESRAVCNDRATVGATVPDRGMFKRGDVWWCGVRRVDGGRRQMSLDTKDVAVATERFRELRRDGEWAPGTPQPYRIYAIRREDTGEVKIGISRDVYARMERLQTAHGAPLELAGVWEGGRREEAAIHRHFASARKLGEWFHETPEITAWINGDIEQEAAA